MPQFQFQLPVSVRVPVRVGLLFLQKLECLPHVVPVLLKNQAHRNEIARLARLRGRVKFRRDKLLQLSNLGAGMGFTFALAFQLF
jgi:hypothetical protein